MNYGSIFIWIVLPYASLVIFVVGHIWRYRHDQFGWTSRSTQILESRQLAWGSILFHYGALAAIAGHVLGILIPSKVTQAVGVSDHDYHLLSAWAGTLAGAVCLAGLFILIYRRFTNRRVLRTTTSMDVVVYALLILLIGSGVWETVTVNALSLGYDYRKTIAIWFRSIFIFHPDTSLMISAPFEYKLHAALPWLIYAVWPFSRLVHVWSVPWQYIGRPYILYRSRSAAARR